ncbi:MAG TPA: biotin/lipoyl-containing protein, partial [Arthrobacter sp.]|nr:biotin/lipoyl-containing protein [Arthrobacter sp.]
MTVNTFNLPDVGEGLTEAEIVSWKVKPGDTVAINDVLCEIETAKSLVELPSPFAGTVTELLVPEGITIDVGTAIISVSDAVSGDPTPADVPAPATPGQPVAPLQPLYGKLPAADADTVDGALAGGPLVGSGPKADAVKRRARKAAPAAPVLASPEVATSRAPATGAA